MLIRHGRVVSAELAQLDTYSRVAQVVNDPNGDGIARLYNFPHVHHQENWTWRQLTQRSVVP